VIRQFRKNEGFSPVEVLIAMGILAIGIMAVVRLFPAGLAFSRQAQEKTIAAELAENSLARMRMAGAGNLLGVAQSGYLYGGIAQANAQYLGMGAHVDSVDMADGRRENFVTYVTDY
jgi:type IV pilus modification protein PilV